nr:MAG TPA: hypothetical protein [Caudoviricetes sp.]
MASPRAISRAIKSNRVRHCFRAIKNPDRFRSGLFLNLFCVRYALKPQLILYTTILLASCQHFY